MLLVWAAIRVTIACMQPCIQHLICPLCGGAFREHGRSLFCAQNHTFDIARQGYVNLIPGGVRTARFPGDDSKMVQARRRFLAAGHFQPLADAVVGLLVEYIDGYANFDETAVLDIGCGEGYYLDQIQNRLADQTTRACFYGVDLSKEAVRLAAAKHKQARFLVADINHNIPFANQSVKLLINFFAPRNPAEFARISSPNGWLLVVIPQPDHLHALRAAYGLLAIETNKQQHLLDKTAAYFELGKQQICQFPLSLTPEDLQNLLQMMPGARHSMPTEIDLSTVEQTQTSASVQILLFQRKLSTPGE